MYISIEQALDVYEELILCKNEENIFGGCSIYVHKLMPYSIVYTMYHEGSEFDEDNRLLEKKAAEDFHSLCYIFSKKHKVKIFIDGIDIHEWINKIRINEIRFFNKIEVLVEKLSTEKNV